MRSKEQKLSMCCRSCIYRLQCSSQERNRLVFSKVLEWTEMTVEQSWNLVPKGTSPDACPRDTCRSKHGLIKRATNLQTIKEKGA